MENKEGKYFWTILIASSTHPSTVTAHELQSKNTFRSLKSSIHTNHQASKPHIHPGATLLHQCLHPHKATAQFTSFPPESRPQTTRKPRGGHAKTRCGAPWTGSAFSRAPEPGARRLLAVCRLALWMPHKLDWFSSGQFTRCRQVHYWSRKTWGKFDYRQTNKRCWRKLSPRKSL